MATLAVVWFLYRQQLQQFEYFTSSPNDCVMYYTTNKAACDAGYYLMSEPEFNVRLKNATLKRNFNLDAVKKERDSTVGRICKLNYNGWSINSSVQPIDNPANPAVLNARGNVNTWMMCRRNITPKPTSPGQLYNSEETQREYEKYQNLFGTYQNVSVEKNPFKPIESNIGKPLSQATPEYIHMYFTSASVKDVNSACVNPTVDYIPNLPSIDPQYGIELSIINQRNVYYINKINLIKTLSREDKSHFVYEDRWQTPSIDKIVELFYIPSINTRTKTLSYVAQNLQMNVYKLLLDECNKLVNLSTKPTITTRTINSGVLFKLPKYDIITKYPFGVRLTYDGRDKDVYNVSYILNYNETTLNNLTNKLEQYIQTLESDYTNRFNTVANINDFSKQKGFVYESYMVPEQIQTIVNEASKTNTIFTDDRIQEGIFNDERSKLVYTAPIPTAAGFWFDANNNQFTNIKTHLSLPTRVVTGTYNFKLDIQRHDLTIKPAKFYVEVLYNEAIVNSYYYCADIDTCKSSKDALLQQYAREKGTSSFEYIALKKSIDNKECDKNNCTITSPFNLTFSLPLNTDINMNRLEIRIYINYPSNNKTKQLTTRLYYNINNRWVIYPTNFCHYNIEDYHPVYQSIFYDKKKFYYPAKMRIQENNTLITNINDGLSNFKSQLRENINNVSIDAFNLLSINKNNIDEFVTKYLSGNERLYMFFTTPKVYTPIAIDNRDAIEDFNKYLITK